MPPYTPDQLNKIPDFLIEAVDSFLRKRWNGNSVKIEMFELKEKTDLTLNQIENFEIPYYFADFGWTVEYNKEDYRENFYFFLFKKKIVED